MAARRRRRRRRAGTAPLARVAAGGADWAVQGAQVAIVDRGRVLLQLRPWPPGWELPGGHCDPGEEPALTAAREAQEETGYSVRITGLVGVYTWAGLRHAGDAVYLGEVTGGRAHRTLESWGARFCEPERLPRTTFPWTRRRVRDALARAQGAEPVHRVQRITIYHVLSFATAWLRVPLDRLRDRRSRR